MTIAVASGKGGTGKTTLAVALARVVTDEVTFLDCDVEEPNAALFLRVPFTQEEAVTLPVPEIDKEKCTACGECSRLCRYNALVTTPSGTTVFPELCHSCGGCALVCPAGAIREVPRMIGRIKSGRAGRLTLVEGELEIGRALVPPLIRAVRRRGGEKGLTIIDCPPGTSCPLVAAASGADHVLLVTEPTAFGLHDLSLAVASLRELALPHSVIINRAGMGDDRVEEWCREAGVPVLFRIPFSRTAAVASSRGEGVLEHIPGLRDLLTALPERLGREA
jgi:MinD superfamily P-loop ATPase